MVEFKIVYFEMVQYRNFSINDIFILIKGPTVNGHSFRNVEAGESGTDDGPETPDSSEGTAPPHNVKKKQPATKGESSTTESTPDKRECRCELCSGASSGMLPQFFSEDSNQNVDFLSNDRNRMDHAMQQMNGKRI